MVNNCNTKINCPHCHHMVTLNEVDLFLDGNFKNGLNWIDCPHCKKTIHALVDVTLKEIGY